MTAGPKMTYRPSTSNNALDDVERAFESFRTALGAGDSSYESGSPEAWAGSPPADVNEAVDRLAAAVLSLLAWAGGGAAPAPPIP